MSQELGEPTGARVAIVTGAARGIGAATVCGLARAGWSVVAVDRCADDPRIPYPLGTRAELDAVAAQAQAQRHPSVAGGVVAHVADATDEAALGAAVAEATAR